MAARMRVAIRVRPALGHEKDEKEAVAVSDEKSVRVTAHSQATAPAAAASAVALKAYTFDRALDKAGTQSDVFNAVDAPGLVDDAIKGYRVAVFAYGQTGSGKTHTLTGGWDGGGGGASDGTSLVPKSLALAYERIAQQSTDRQFALRVSFVEIYNDSVSDLLSDLSTARLHESTSLPVRHHKQRGFYVDGALERDAPSLEDAVVALGEGLSRRHVRAHRLNAHSSRSHCLFTLHIDSWNAEPAPGGRRKGGRHGRLTFVDLAGSERLRDTGSQRGEAIREAGHINKSLFHLGKVITALATRRKPTPGGIGAVSSDAHVPYRDCALTKLLYDAMSGKGRATMIGCLSPTAAAADESRSTLHFASLAMRLEAKPVLVLDEHDQLVHDLRGTIAELRAENKQLLEQLKAMQEGEASKSARGNTLPDRYTNFLAGDHAARPKTGPRGGPTARRALVLDRSGGPPSSPKRSRDRAVRTSYESALPALHSPGKAQAASSPVRAWGTPTKHSAKPDQIDANSELAALEAKFRKNLSTAMEQDASTAVIPAAGTQGASSVSDLDELERRTKERLRALKAGGAAAKPKPQPPESPVRSSPRNPVPAVSPARPPPPPPARSPLPPPSPPKSVGPDQKAIDWAQRNPWFGRDQDMTMRAYAEHDRLVGRLGYDPTSDEYYEAIETAVRATFPHKFPPPQKEGPRRGQARHTKASSKRAEAVGRASAVRATTTRRSKEGPREPLGVTASASAAAASGAVGGYSGHASKRSVNARMDAAFELSGVGLNLHKRRDGEAKATREEVVASLQQMKAEAEAERRQIMAQIRARLRETGSAGAMYR